MTTKISAVVDGLGSRVRFTLTPGQRAEITQARMLIEGLPFGALLADKAYDADHFRSFLKSREIEVVIPPRKRRRHPASYDATKYKWRHGIENFFQKLKEFKRRHAGLQNREKLRGHDMPRRNFYQNKMKVNVNRP